MSETASVTTSTLAVADKRPRKTGGCVGIFFQLIDWNRRFAKKKLFSKRLLPPDRAKEASKKLGGDDKLPKLRLIADENSGGFPNMKKNGSSSVNNPAGVETPSLVARLMGLESMPSVKLLKNSSNEFSDGRKEKALNEFEKESIRQEFRPQKLRKTETIDRRNVTRFGAEALQLKNVLSRSRKHHHHHPKLASPVKNNHTKTNSSRLIGAATRILEPGRNKSKYAIMYAHSSRSNLNPIKAQNENVDFLSGQTSCKNCGNPVDNARKSVFDSVNQPQPPINFENNNRKVVDYRISSQPKVNSVPEFNNDTKDFVALNRNLSGRTRPRVPTKVEDTKFDKRNKFDNQGQKRQFTHIRKQGESCGFEDFSKSVKFNSPMKNMNELPRKRNQNSSFSRNNSHKKFIPNKSDEKKPFPLKGDCLNALLEEKLHQLTNQVHYENGNLPKRSPSNIFQELICALNMEQRPLNHKDLQFTPQRNHLSQKLTPKCEYDHKTSFFLQTKPEKMGSLIGRKNNDHFSPGSVLEASFSNDSCCSSSLEDSSVRTQHADSMSYSYDESLFQESETDPFFYSGTINTHNELATNLITYISQVLSTIDFVNSRITRAHIIEVIFNSELVLANQIPHNPDKINSFFVCDLLLELNTLVEIMVTRFGNFLGYDNSNSKRFVSDALIEYLELKYGKYSKCGFRVWMNIPPFMGCEILIDEVMEEVRKWVCLVGGDSDELVERDMSCCLGKWIDFEVEEYEMGAKIEGDVIQMLIDEIVFDFLINGV